MRSIIFSIVLVSVFLGCSGNVPPSIEKRVKGILECDRDIQLYAEVVARDSNNVQAYFSLGKTHLDKSKALGPDRYGDVPIAAIAEMELAAQSYDRALRLAPHQLNDDQLEELGEVYSFLKRHDWYSRGEQQREVIRRFGSRVRNAARSNLGSSRAWFNLSIFYPWWEDELSEYCLMRAIEIDPTYKDAYLDLAARITVGGKTGRQYTKYTLAHIWYYHSAKLGSLSAAALGNMIEYYNNDLLRPSLLQSYRDSLKAVPKAVQALFEVGMWPFVKNADDRLRELSSRLLTIDPSRQEVLAFFAWKGLARRDTARALEFYFRSNTERARYSRRFIEKAIAVKPLFGPAYADLAREVKDQDSAIFLLQKAINLERGDPACYFERLSWAYQSKDNLDMAIFWMEKWFEVLSQRGFPIYSTWSAFSSLASLYLQKQDVDAMRRLIQRALTIKGIDLVHSVLRALSYEIGPKNVRLNALEEMIDKKLGLSSKYKSVAYRYLGDAHLSDAVIQLKYYRRALDLQPSNEDLRRHVLTDVIKRGNYPKVLAVLRQWRDATTLYTFGEDLRSNGKTKESSLFFSTANEMDPDLAVEAFEEAKIVPPEFKYSTEQYQKAARLGYGPARDTLKARNVSW